MPTGPRNEVPLLGKVQTWQILKWESAKQAARAKELNQQISAEVDALGHEDDKGHIWYDLPRPVVGYDTEGNQMMVSRLQRQRRVSVTMDEEEAADILKAKGVFNDMATHWIRVTDPELAIAILKVEHPDLTPDVLPDPPEVSSVLSQDLVEAAYFEGIITKAEFDRIFTSNVSFALLTP